MYSIFDWLGDTSNTYTLKEFSEWLTIVVSSVGIFVCLRHALFFNRSRNKTSKKVKKVFLTDAAVYLVTFLMGVGLYFNLPVLVHYDIIIRPFVLILNIVATVALYIHFKKLK